LKKNYFLRTAVLMLAAAMFGLCIVPGTMSRYVEGYGSGSFKAARAGLFEVAILRGQVNGVDNWVSIVNGTTDTPFKIDLYQTLYQDYDVPYDAPEAAYDSDYDGPYVFPGAHPKGFGPGVSNQGTIASQPEGLIAPGCGGAFRISVKNFSEVKVKAELEVDNLIVLINNVPGALDDGNMIQWWDPDPPSGAARWVDYFPGNAAGVADELDPLGASGSVLNKIFYWRWLYERGGTAWHTGTPAGAGWANGSDLSDTALGIKGITQVTALMVPLEIKVEQID